jgi:uncharacterized protein (DUF488 family)
MSLTIYTIGHSTREFDELVDILKEYKIEQLIDVRTVPKSRHVPQFNHDTLEKKLPKEDIAYLHLSKLGGLRHVRKDSINQGWHNKSFRGYADYMQTEEFAEGMDQLEKLAKDKQVAIMCAEALPWRCHRSMIGDALLVRKHKVIDIFDIKKTQDEKLTSFAKVKGKTITYPDDGESDKKTAQDD